MSRPERQLGAQFGDVLGTVGPALLGRAACLAILGAVGLAISSRRLGRLLLS
jgi:hypothetical protein